MIDRKEVEALRALLARFHTYHTTEPNSGCWLWTGGTDGHKGYGVFSVDRKARRAHRASWELHRGPIPPGMWVLHRCDTPACVNPDHLFLGTHADNMADMTAKGRRGALAGEAHGAAKLSADDVRSIRAESGTEQAIAEKYGISTSQIGRIRRGERWRNTVGGGE